MLYVDVALKKFVVQPGNRNHPLTNEIAQVIANEETMLTFQLLNSDGMPFALNATDSFDCGGDTDFDHSNELMFYSPPEKCTVVDAEQGILSVIVDSRTESFNQKCSSGSVNMILQLRRYTAGDAIGKTVVQDDLLARATVIDNEGAPEPSTPGYYTAAQVDALLAAGFVIRYSEAGGDDPGHDVPTDADYYYRFRAATAPDSAPWTAWLKFRGVDGVDGNTFEVVESAEPPTVTTEGAFVLWHKTEA